MAKKYIDLKFDSLVTIRGLAAAHDFHHGLLVKALFQQGHVVTLDCPVRALPVSALRAAISSLGYTLRYHADQRHLPAPDDGGIIPFVAQRHAMANIENAVFAVDRIRIRIHDHTLVIPNALNYPSTPMRPGARVKDLIDRINLASTGNNTRKGKTKDHVNAQWSIVLPNGEEMFGGSISSINPRLSDIRFPR